MAEPKPRLRHWSPNPDPASIVIPGVDTGASVNDQIDQIDQLITIRLQNIDANFSRIQSLIANKLLPAFKRYAESTEPVRDAAKFWKSFYEAAAQVRIPISSEVSSLYEDVEESEEQETTIHLDNEKTPVNAAPPEDSFAHGAPVSSTPLVRDPTNVALPLDNEDESWEASIESPFERLERRMNDLTMEETINDPSVSSAPSFSPLHGSYTGTLPNLRQDRSQVSTQTQVPVPRSHKKGKTPLRKSVLQQNVAMAAASDIILTPGTSKFMSHQKTPRNPFILPHSNSHKWNGIVDLGQPSPARSRTLSTPGITTKYDSDSSDDLIPPGMSPPVTMQFALPNRYHTSPIKLNLTPARTAAERISSNLIANAASKGIGTSQRLPVRREQSESSIAPSLPSLSRYTSHQGMSSASISSGIPPQTSSTLKDVVTPAQQIYRARIGPHLFQPTVASVSPESLNNQQEGRYEASYLNPRLLMVDEGVPPSPASDTDSDSSEHNESNPSAGFLFATQNNARSADDSFESSQHSFSSDEDEDEAARVARHPLAHMFVGDGGVDDSFDDSFAQGGGGEDEETVFGGRQVGTIPADQRQLTLMRDALIDDTYTGVVSLNPFAQVEQSPTPFIDGQSGGPLGSQ